MDSASAGRQTPVTPRQPRRWIVRLFADKSRSQPAKSDAPDGDPLALFAAEHPDPSEAPAPPSASGTESPHEMPSGVKWWIAGVAGALLIVATVAAGTMRIAASPGSTPDPGTLIIESRPAGAAVVIDGRDRGHTPLTLSIEPGKHEMTMASGLQRRTVHLEIVSGREASQYFEFAPPRPVVTNGNLSVTADKASRVTIDGQFRGSTPLVVTDLAAGEHQVSIAAGSATADRKVMVQAGVTSSAAFSFARAAGPVAGWLSVSAPFDLQVFDGPDLVATSGAKVMLAAGRHDLRLVNAELGYDEARRLDIVAGQVSTVHIEPPMGAFSANARPWADVWIDGVKVGQTPLANIPIAVGPHVVVFRHPEFPDQQRTVMVTKNGPNRISADLTRK